ncbi:tripartite tricarboxylate transporter permease [uncultured Rhodospira sp.]|uniref:tripartite tricarboxylate transporter permease n=1 Tax=uncultured Rhodospira sp. TaxID=1936189 RepID=UPI002619A935|nr:tripartite tricarboxylate transporter permease [uncultured Rhodospira sp.]
MDVLSQFGLFFATLAELVTSPVVLAILLLSSLSGIAFGALPGLTATLGVALLTTLTYGLPLEHALVALLAMYVGAVYGGSYPAILVNIPGTAASAASAMEGYPLAQRGEGARALGLTTTASFIGTAIGMLFLVLLAPQIVTLALQFTSYEVFLLAVFGILISGTLTSSDLVVKGWIAGLLGLALSTVGRDQLQFYPRFTVGMPELDSGLEVVPVLIGAFAIPQIIRVLRDDLALGQPKTFKRILPEFRTIVRNAKHNVRSALVGVGIGSVPGIGEDIAGWVSYGGAKSTSRHPETFGKGEPAGLVSSETANNACIGGALIPLLSLGIPGSPPAVMLLGALMIHGVTVGPMIEFDRPGFIIQVTAILLLASAAMWINGMLLARHVVKVLRVPPAIFMPVVAVLSVNGSYALGLNVFNLYLMVPIGIAAYFLTEWKYPISPLVIGVILGPMADENLRRAMMVSNGDFTPFVTRPVALILLIAIVLIIASQVPPVRRAIGGLGRRLMPARPSRSAAQQTADG